MKNSLDESNFFDRLVIKHYKLKNKRHISGDKTYSDYDVAVGFLITLALGVAIFVSLFIASLLLIPLLFCWVMNAVDFTKKDSIIENDTE